MALRSKEAWEDFKRGHVLGLWDWSPFSGCFNRGVRFSDIDGIVDDDGHFLVIEGKTAGSGLKKGQEILFRNLSLLSNFIVVIVVGYPPKDVKYWYTYNHEIEGSDLKSLQEFIEGWWYSDKI